MTENSSDSKSRPSNQTGKILLVLGLCLSIGFWTYIFYSDYILEEGEVIIPKSDYEGYNITKLVVNYDTDIVPVKVNISNPSDKYIFTCTWRHLFTDTGEAEQDKIEFQISDILGEDNETIIIDIITIIDDVNGDEETNFFGMNIWEVDIYINPEYILNLTMNNSAGAIDLVAKHAIFNKFDINQNFGSIDLYMDECTINNSFNILGDSGEIDLLIDDTIFNTAAMIESDSGSINIKITDSNIPDFNVDDNSGSIDIELGRVWVGTQKISSDSGEMNLVWKNITLQGDITINQNSGSFGAEISSVLMNADYKLDSKVNSGSTDIYWNQPISMGATISMNLLADSGSITVDVRAFDPTEFIINADANSGSEDISVEPI